MHKMSRTNLLVTALLVGGFAILAVTAASAEGDAVASAEAGTAGAAAIAPTNTEILSAESESSPTPTVEIFHAGLLEIMKEAKTLGFQGRIDKLGPLMGEVFDLEFMASKTVGRNWRKLSDEEKRVWVSTFTEFTTASYAGRFTGFKGEEFVTLGEEEAARNTRNVLTKIIVPDDDDVQLNYRLIERNGQWKVIDVYLDGTVSELALRRSEYASVLKRQGFEELIVAIETKIADLKAKGLAEG